MTKTNLSVYGSFFAISRHGSVPVGWTNKKMLREYKGIE